MKMKNLEKCFVSAEEGNANYIAVLIETQGNEAPELIINPGVNFKNKLDYYKKAYSDDLVLNNFSGIKIIGFTHADTLQEIETQLLK